MRGTTLIRALFISTLFFCISESLWAAEDNAPEDTGDNTIEVRVPANANAHYRERRTRFGYNLGFGYEQFAPDSYASPIDGVKYKQLFGSENVTLTEITGGLRMNFKAVSISAEALYGTGSMSSTASGDRVSLALTKKGGQATFAIDGFLAEPWVVPYASAEAFMFDYTEKSSLDTQSGSTSFTTAFKVGGLLQLNWIDTAAAHEAYVTSGLENAFVDIYMIQYNTSYRSTDPDLKTKWSMGLGLKLEF